ncbi:MAG TPA: PA14 domain-containing protein [Sedimentisphaerales bacterium]|nr:PA14 domain-containing protein [Sedimentisphaerales bacterium]
MSSKTLSVLAVVTLVGISAFLPCQARAEHVKKPGLLGARYGGSDFEGLDREPRIIITSLDKDWTHGSKDYSCRWYGYIVGPFTGEVNFAGEADNGLILKIDDKLVIDGKDKNGSGSFSMRWIA